MVATAKVLVPGTTLEGFGKRLGGMSTISNHAGRDGIDYGYR